MIARFRFPIFIGIIISLCGSVNTSYAQIDRIEDFIKAGADDAETLTKAYLSPYGKGIGSSLNTGWFNTASPHQTLGFDLQIRAAAAVIPDGDRTFNFNGLSLNNMELADGEMPISQTVGGDDTAGPQVIINDNNGDEISRLNLPEGSGFHYVPAPMIQASVGIIKDTDLIIRYLPEVSIDDYGNFDMLGFGLKHSLNQWLPGGQFLPVNLALMAGYNRINLDTNLSLDPEENAVPDPDYNGSYDDQKILTTVNTFTLKLLASKDLPFLTVYAGAGYETSTFSLDAVGSYPITVEVAEGVERTDTITDPFSYDQDGANDLSLTGGLKFKVFFFHVYGEYTFANYPIANAGIGFSFR